MAVPSNTRLYEKIKSEAKRKFKVWPSAYGSAWLVKEYKRRGGKYSTTSNKSSYKRKSKAKSKKKSQYKRSRKTGLSRWFDEKWIDVCKLPRKVSCGRSKSSRKNYPYCRPLNRISSKTPKTVREIGFRELKSRCKRKRKSPYKKVFQRKSKK